MNKKQSNIIKHNLPSSPSFQFVGRKHEINLIKKLLFPGFRLSVICISGIGGIGKTALALEIAYQHLRPNLRKESKFDSIIWINLNRSALTSSGIVNTRKANESLPDIINTILQVLDIPSALDSKINVQVAIVNKYLEQSRTLLIIDGFEILNDNKIFDFVQNLPSLTRTIITSRYAVPAAFQIRLEALNDVESLKLIEAISSVKDLRLSDNEKEKLIKVTNGIPLALNWSVSRIFYGVSLNELSKSIGAEKPNDLMRFIFVDAIERIRGKPSYRALLALSLLGGTGNRQSIKFVSGLTEEQVNDGLQELYELSLINRELSLGESEDHRFMLSPLTTNFVEKLLEEESISFSEKVTLNSWTRFLSQVEIKEGKDTTEEKFDIFIAHNSSEKEAVREIASRLKKRNLKPWIDTEQIRPGTLFQASITTAINNIKSFAVVIGESGVGKFQTLEIKTFISKAVDAGIPIIPVLLPGVKGLSDEGLLFLREFQWIQFSDIDDENAYDLLEWGITGVKPKTLLDH